MRRFRSDFKPIDYPVSYGHSLGRYGTTVDQRIAWSSITEVPNEIFQALSIFLKRVLNTYSILDKLFSERPYVDAYGKETVGQYIQAYASTRSLPEIIEPYGELYYPEAYLQPLMRGVWN